mmetsp:Transcript_50735/g.147734  ORF Transcript_50735/g.147734 Transcript_50735/m.147734 type:complete len:304 (+) Transcript_50735:80-991(+)
MVPRSLAAMRRSAEGPDVREAVLAKGYISSDVALELAHQVLGLAEGEIMEAMHLVLSAEDVVVRDFVGSQEGTGGDMPQDNRAAGGYGLPVHLQAASDVRVQDLPLSFAGGLRERCDLLVPRELCGRKGSHHLAVHERRPGHLAEWRHNQAQHLPIMDHIVIEAIVVVGPVDEKGIPNRWVGARRSSDHERLGCLLDLIVGVHAQPALGLMTKCHDRHAKVQHAVKGLGQLSRLQALLQLLLFGGDLQFAAVLLRQEILQSQFLQLLVLAPIADAGVVVVLRAAGKLLRGELHAECAQAARLT